MWKVNILTLFPEIYLNNFFYSIFGRSLRSNSWYLEAQNIRNYSLNKRGIVDSSPYGGGSGMVLKPDTLGTAVENFFLKNTNPIIYLTPRGALFNQLMAKNFAKIEGVNILCGRFEGIDERIIKEYSMFEVSIGDYILSSGDIAAFVLMDCCLRFVEGYISNKHSLIEESFGEDQYNNLLEYPHYAKPMVWKSNKVPEVLISGNHKEISEWRFNQAKKTTKDRRPDLWNKYLKGDINEPS